MENYFNYFTEIEEHFQRRRGGILLLSTLDWALIEIWKDAGIPLAAALRGIDAAFEHYEQRPTKSRKVNSLAYCAQEVLAAAEEMKEAAVGVASQPTSNDDAKGFSTTEIISFLNRNAAQIAGAKLPESLGISCRPLANETSKQLRDLAAEIEDAKTVPKLEALERRLAVMEEKLMAVLLATTPDDQIVSVRAQGDRELAPYRSKMTGTQIDQLQKQYLQKKLLEAYRLPRLSLFYM
ncbi:MAG: hypothetical protein M3O09_03450 [Acidobacteriota bacterium]|nr:hypothetical protein [Acidobacteriota bacterium]